METGFSDMSTTAITSLNSQLCRIIDNSHLSQSILIPRTERVSWDGFASALRLQARKTQKHLVSLVRQQATSTQTAAFMG
jgi:hypothetical protein